MSRSTIALRALVAVAGTLASGAAATDPAPAPFSASFVTREALRINLKVCRSFPFLVGTTTGTGQSSSLGAVTGTGSDCIHPTLKGRFSFTSGRMTIATTAGDTIRAEYSGTLNRTSTPRTSAITGTYRIVGGTGRYRGASGNGTLSGVENLATRKGRLQFTGTLACDACAEPSGRGDATPDAPVVRELP